MPQIAISFLSGSCFIFALQKCSNAKLDVTDVMLEGKNTIVFFNVKGFVTIINFILRNKCKGYVTIIN